jgi:DNA-binding beta-propeller fold protein YncE
MRKRSLVISAAGIALLATTTALASAATGGGLTLGERTVGRQTDGSNSVVVAENKFIRPVGTSIEQTGQVMDLAVRPDGKVAVDLTKSGDGLFTVVDLVADKVVQQYTPPKGTGSADVGLGGLLFSADGTKLWATQSKNLIRFDVAADGKLSAPAVIALPAAGPDAPGAQPIPSGLTWAPDGTTILTTLSGHNAVVGIDSATGTVAWRTPVGLAPKDLVVVGNHVYVGNEAGRRPTSTDTTSKSYSSDVVAKNGRANSGTVSELDLATHQVVREYKVGLDPTALIANGTDVLVANAADDTVSILDTGKGRVQRTFNVNPLPGQPFGSSPNALAMLDDTHLAVSLGRNNALGIYELHGGNGNPAFAGLVPTAWYPGRIIVDKPLGKIVIGNLKGVGALGKERTITEGPGTQPATAKQVYSDVGVVQLMDPPKPEQMAKYTSTVFENNQWYALQHKDEIAAEQQKAAPVPVPARVGDPSTIKHVILLVRENRTYDQVLGDDPRGNGAPALAQFGKGVTPNAHAIAERFPLIDNLYSEGTNSASGHTWLDAAFVNDYLERSYANYVRSYGQPDAMVYPKSGFLWDNALAHGKSVKVWGEYAKDFVAPDGTHAAGNWADWYRDSQILEGKQTGELHTPVGYNKSISDIPSLDGVLSRNYPLFDTKIPDQYRTDLFLKDLQGYEKDGKLPNLNMLWLSSDHTNGTSAGYPIPTAMQADSDLAVGRIVEAVSHSKYWKDTAVISIEDDSQNGVDHVDGHRNVMLVASPYAKKGAVVSTYYSQANVTRTVEQILGLPPMNQLDLAAQPMYDAFTTKPDFTPYTALPNNIPLDTMNKTAAQATSTVEKQWIDWSQQQDFSKVDMLAFEPFNRMTWYSSNNYTKPYPGDDKVMTPAEVLAKFPQAAAPIGDADGNLPETKSQIPAKAGR